MPEWQWFHRNAYNVYTMLILKADQRLVQQHFELEPKIMIPGPYSSNAFVMSFYLQCGFTPFESSAKGWGISWAWESRHFQNTARHIALIFRKDTAPPQPQSLPCPVSQVFEYPDSKIPLYLVWQVRPDDPSTKCSVEVAALNYEGYRQRWRQHTFKVPLHSGRCLSYSSLLPAFISRSVASGEGGPMRCGSVTRDGIAFGKMEGASSTLILPRHPLMAVMTTASILTWKAASPYAASTAHSGPSQRKLNCQQH